MEETRSAGLGEPTGRGNFSGKSTQAFRYNFVAFFLGSFNTNIILNELKVSWNKISFEVLYGNDSSTHIVTLVQHKQATYHTNKKKTKEEADW
jgi:hypothetical protein